MTNENPQPGETPRKEGIKTISEEARLILSESPTDPSGWLQNLGHTVSLSQMLKPATANLLIGSRNISTPVRASVDANSLFTWTHMPSARTVTTHKGTDVYDVLWSVDVTTALDLRRPSIDDIVHVETIWEPVA